MRRKEIRQKKNRLKMRKFLTGTLFLIIVFGGSIHVTFADEDIGVLLSNWFDRKTTDSIETIDDAISTEQQEQANQLKEELRLEIEIAEEHLHAFTNAEKEKRIAELESYADALLSDFTVQPNELENTIILELERILIEAKDQMNAVSAMKNPDSEDE